MCEPYSLIAFGIDGKECLFHFYAFLLSAFVCLFIGANRTSFDKIYFLVFLLSEHYFVSYRYL